MVTQHSFARETPADKGEAVLKNALHPMRCPGRDTDLRGRAVLARLASLSLVAAQSELDPAIPGRLASEMA